MQLQHFSLKANTPIHGLQDINKYVVIFDFTAKMVKLTLKARGMLWGLIVIWPLMKLSD